MIYLVQNSREYDYDVRAIALAFLQGEKIRELSAEEVRELCQTIYRETEGPMILGTGCLVAPRTPKENIDAMVQASRSVSGTKG